MNLYLVKFEALWNLKEQAFYCFYYFVYLKVNLVLEKTKQLGESSPNFIFVAVILHVFLNFIIVRIKQP